MVNVIREVRLCSGEKGKAVLLPGVSSLAGRALQSSGRWCESSPLSLHPLAPVKANGRFPLVRVSHLWAALQITITLHENKTKRRREGGPDLAQCRDEDTLAYGWAGHPAVNHESFSTSVTSGDQHRPYKEGCSRQGTRGHAHPPWCPHPPAPGSVGREQQESSFSLIA